MKIILLALLLTASGCGHLSTSQVEETFDPVTGSLTGRRATHARIATVFDSKSQLGKLRTTNTEKTQGIGLSDFSSESNGTNSVAALQEIGRILLLLK